MGLKLYFVIITYFFTGGVFTFFINRKKDGINKKSNWLKYFTYFIIVNTLFLSILIKPFLFKCIDVLIIVLGLFEIVLLMFRCKNFKTGIISLLIFAVPFWGFLKFCFLEQKYLLFTVLLVTIFDAFSQLTGQAIGKRKLLPKISPNKTVEGLLGGFFISAVTSLLCGRLLNINVLSCLIYGLGVVCFAFLGDISASAVKRKFGVKDFSNFIPAHGGFLDRFDSLVFSGFFMYGFHYFL